MTVEENRENALGMTLTELRAVGCCLYELHSYGIAEVFLQAGLHIDPNDVHCLNSLGGVLVNTGEYGKARYFLEKALRLDGRYAAAWLNMGVALDRQGEWDSGRKSLLTACELHPPFEDAAWIELGFNSEHQCRYDWAQAEYRAALRLNPQNYKARFYLGLLQMRQGDWLRGLPNYEARFYFTPIKGVSNVPLWNGEDTLREKRRVLVVAEQGTGDAIQFARYASLLSCYYQDTSFSLLCEDRIAPLLRRFAGWESVHTYSEEKAPGADVQMGMMSLPLLLWRLGHTEVIVPNVGMRVESVPREHGGVRHIGICLRGDPNNFSDPYRSIFDKGLVEPLLRMQDTYWHSLEPIEGQTWEGTLRMLQDLDAVVTVDTAVAHLAGTLGVPTYLMLAANSDWRWGEAGDRTEWYDSVRIFRQAKLGDWAPVVADIQKELANVHAETARVNSNGRGR